MWTDQRDIVLRQTGMLAEFNHKFRVLDQHQERQSTIPPHQETPAELTNPEVIEQFEAKHTGVGTDDLDNLIQPLSECRTPQAIQEHINEDTNTVSEANSIKTSPMHQNHQAHGNYSRQVFQTFISGLSKQQKIYLYNKQLDKAYEYQSQPRDAQALST